MIRRDPADSTGSVLYRVDVVGRLRMMSTGRAVYGSVEVSACAVM